jgi:peptidoglycan/xylan/chitin deacetylase (PgdA/CDA1 family)
MLKEGTKNRQPDDLRCHGCGKAIAAALTRIGSLRCLDCRHGDEAIDPAVTRARSRHPYRRIGALGMGLLLVALVLTTFPSSGVSGLVTSTLNPTDDAYVSESAPSTNFGTATQLYAGGSPITRSYLKFDVPTLAGPVSKATLRLYATASSPTGFEVRSAANNWSETKIAYKTAPAPSSTVTGSSGSLTAGSWATVDVTPLVQAGRTITLALTSTASPADALGSRESPNQPQLVVDVNDTTAPVVTLTAPAKGASLTTPLPTYSGKAGSAAGDASLVTLKVYSGSTATGTPLQTLSASRQNNNSYSVTATSPLPNGTYTAQAQQSDAAGNTGFSSANTFTLADTTPPTVTLTQPANGATVATATPTFSGVAGSAAGDGSTVAVQVYAGSSASGTPVQTLSATRQADNSYSVTATSSLTNGTYTAQAQQSDAAGNVGFSSANTFTVSVSAGDTTPPTVTLTQPADGASVSTALPTFAGVAGSAAGDSSLVMVKVYSGSSASGTPVQTLSAGRQADNSYSVVASAPLVDGGTYTARAEQSDAAGNTGFSSANTFTVALPDTTPPTVTLTQPADGSSVSTAFPTFAGVAGSAPGDNSLVTVNVYPGSSASGTPVQTLTATRQADNSYSVTTTSPLASGTYTARAQQGDAADNTGLSSANTFTVSVPDTTPPTVTLTQPANGATVSTATPTFSGVAGNAPGDSATVTVKVYSGSSASGTPLQTLSATRQADNTYSVTGSSPLANATYTVQAEQQDAAGNTGRSSANTFGVSVPVNTPPEGKLVVIVMENQPYDSIVGSTQAPYLNQLIARGKLFTNYTSAAPSSNPNYLAMTSGLTSALSPPSPNVFQAIDHSGTTTWKEFMESMGGNCAAGQTGNVPGTTDPLYTADHDPAYSYRANTTCTTNDVPMNTNTFNPSNLPTLSYVVPNECDDMHTLPTSLACPAYFGSNSGTSQINLGDNWLSTVVPSLLAQPNVTVLITWDEGTNQTTPPQHIVTLEVGAGVGSGSSDGTAYNPYNLEAGLYQYLGLGVAPNNGATAAPLPIPRVLPPSVSLTQPGNGATVSTATPTFSGVAGSAPGDNSLVTVKVYSGSSASGTPVQTLSASRQADNSYSVVASSPLPEGTYTARAEQTDTGGNTGFSSANTFTVSLPDTTPPVVTLTQPADGATVATATPTFAGVAGNAPGDNGLVTVNVYAGSSASGTPLQTLSAGRQGDNSYSVVASAPLADGTYTAQAQQGDAAGNTGFSSANTFTVSVPDTTPPTVTLTQPANGAGVSTAMPTFAGVAGNAAGDSSLVTVNVYAGSSASGSPLQTLSAGRQADNSYSVVALGPLANGTYTAQAQQGDAAGNTGFSSANTFTVSAGDTTPPTVTLTQPANGATVATATPTFSGVAGDVPGDSSTVTVNVYSGPTATGTPLQTLTTTSQADNSYSVTATSPLANGTYTARAQQGDAAGNTGFSSANTFTVSDTTAPTVTLTQPANNASLTTATPTFSGVAGNAPGDSSAVTVKVYSGSTATGTPVQTLTATRQADNSYSVTATTSLSNGTFTAQAQQSDAAGNTGSSSANKFTITIVIVSLTFNDGPTSQYTYARPILESHNMNGTFYVASGWVDNRASGYMLWGQLDTLYRDGNEVGGMDTDHKDLTQVYYADWTQDYAYKKQEVCGDHDRLKAMGYDPQSFAYPAAAYNYTFPDGSTVEGIVKSCGYLSGRTAGGLSTSGPTYAEPVPPRDAYALRTAGLPSSAITLTALQNAVTAAASHGGGWVPIAFNAFCHQGDANYSTCIGSTNKPIDDATFAQFLDWLRNAGQPGGAPPSVDVRTVRQVMGAPPQPPLPPRPTVVSLTFDDGSATQYDARSILASHGMHGTFFINSPLLGSDPTYMTWSQINDLSADGNEIGGHTANHVRLTQVDSDEAARQICYDRNLLLNHGVAATDFAYPYGAFNASIESIAQSCGYNSARGAESVGNTCPPTCAETIPPKDLYATRVVGNGTDSLSTLENKVISAEQNGSGWVQVVIHNVCNGCNSDAMSPATLSSFLDWLQPRAANGTVVKTVQQVIGGAVKPAVAGPPLPPPVGATNGLKNSSLEQDANGDGVPDCFVTDSWGSQTRTWTRTTDAHTGTYAERVVVSGYASGADKLNVSQDLGYCAPTVTPGHRYTLTTWYKSTAPVDFVVEKRNGTWAFPYWVESTVFPATSTWSLASWTTPVVPTGINGLSFGLSLAANGSMTVDDIGIVDANP